MKLTVAAGILAQTLPTVLAGASNENEGWLLGTRNDDQRHVLTEEMIPNKRTYSQSNIVKNGGANVNAMPAFGPRRSTGIKMRLKNAKPTPALTSCDPSSNEPDVGILSCGLNRICKPSEASSLGGVCVDAKSPKLLPMARMGTRGPLKNSPRDTESSPLASTECDPSSVDVGILACGPGEQCVENGDSKLGGFCTGSFFKRRTQVDYDYTIPLDELCQERICDCSGFDYISSTGTIECKYEYFFGDYFYGCSDVQGQLSVTYDVQSASSYNITDCYEVTAPRTESLCFTYVYSSGVLDPSCEATFNGEACGVCTNSDAYDTQFSCANVGGPTHVSTTPLPVLEQCNIPVNGTYCSLCPNGFSYLATFQNTMFDFGGFGDGLTCSRLAEVNINNLISEARCPEAIAIAEASCCALIDYALPPYDPCYICGGNNVTYFYRDFEVGSSGFRYCDEAETVAVSGYFNESYCEYISTLASASWCSAEPTAPGLPTPTSPGTGPQSPGAAPSITPGGEPDTSSPPPSPSGASSISFLSGAAAGATAMFFAWN